MNQENMQAILIDYITNHQADYYRVAYSYVKNKQDALDIVQESIMKALTTNRPIQQAEEEKIKSWFYRIIINTSIDFLRKYKRNLYVEDHVLEMVAKPMQDHYRDFDLEQAIDSLPTKHKTVIMLRYFEYMKLEEIADLLDENINTIKTRLYAAHRKLKIVIDEADIA